MSKSSKYVAVFRGELWRGHGQPDLEPITKCVIEESSEESAKKTAESMIPNVANRYRFPFGSEDDGHSPITEDEIYVHVIPLPVYVRALEEEAAHIRAVNLSAKSEEE